MLAYDDGGLTTAVVWPPPPRLQVNVGNLTLGRQGTDLALCLLTVDGKVPPEALEKLDALDSVHEIRAATL